MKLKINSLNEIEQAALSFLEYLNKSEFSNRSKVIAFYGEMGVGKTTFIKALCKSLGVEDEVTSPTFSLINEYFTKDNQSIFHFDFYRINSIEEAFDFGYEDYFYSGNFCFVEWPELVENLLPEDFLRVEITENEDNTREYNVIQNTQN